MTGQVWKQFRAQTAQALRNSGAEIHFEGVGDGIFEGHREESATWVASVISDRVSANAKVAFLRLTLAALAKTYGQECIALTVGRSEFLNSDGTVTINDN